MTLRSNDDRLFTSGSCRYSSERATVRESLNRLFVNVAIEGELTDAVLDTGGAHCIIPQEFARDIQLHRKDALGQDRLNVRGVSMIGSLHRVELKFVATVGASFAIDVTAFVPEPPIVWDLPVYLGWHNYLERLRFALDPETESFHFGGW